jgi:hypothetical protein
MAQQCREAQRYARPFFLGVGIEIGTLERLRAAGFFIFVTGSGGGGNLTLASRFAVMSLRFAMIRY